MELHEIVDTYYSMDILDESFMGAYSQATQLLHRRLFKASIEPIQSQVYSNIEATQKVYNKVSQDTENYSVIKVSRNKNRLVKSFTAMSTRGFLSLEHSNVFTTITLSYNDAPTLDRLLDIAKVDNFVCKLYTDDKNVMFAKLKDPRSTNMDYYPSTHVDDIQKVLQEVTPGLVLLTGNPGTGKSRFAEHLCANNTFKKNIFLTDAKTAVLMLKPDSLEEIKNSIVIVEEGDPLIEDRKKNPKFDSSFLDITSGITAETYGIIWVITTNLSLDHVDPAIKRRGRMLLHNDFRNLTRKEIKILNDKGLTKIDSIPSDGMSLADIFLYQEDEALAPERKVIGFR